MDNSIPQTQSSKKWPLVVSVIIVLLVIVGGVFLYKKTYLSPEQKQQQMIEDTARSAAEITTSIEEQTKFIKDAQNAPSVVLPPEEASNAELNIINQFNEQ